MCGIVGCGGALGRWSGSPRWLRLRFNEAPVIIRAVFDVVFTSFPRIIREYSRTHPGYHNESSRDILRTTATRFLEYLLRESSQDGPRRFMSKLHSEDRPIDCLVFCGPVSHSTSHLRPNFGEIAKFSKRCSSLFNHLERSVPTSFLRNSVSKSGRIYFKRKWVRFHLFLKQLNFIEVNWSTSAWKPHGRLDLPIRWKYSFWNVCT